MLRERIVKAIEALSAATYLDGMGRKRPLLKNPIQVDETMDNENLAEFFLKSCESVPQKLDNYFPNTISDVYNDLVEQIDKFGSYQIESSPEIDSDVLQKVAEASGGIIVTDLDQSSGLALTPKEDAEKLGKILLSQKQTEKPPETLPEPPPPEPAPRKKKDRPVVELTPLGHREKSQGGKIDIILRKGVPVTMKQIAEFAECNENRARLHVQTLRRSGVTINMKYIEGSKKSKVYWIGKKKGEQQ